MSSGTIFDVPAVPRLQALLQDVKQGTILIPRFQRTFVWKDEQRFRLLDSVLKGLPIGSLMVWRSSREEPLECYDRLGPFRLNINLQRSGYRSYLLDGLQRLTTLYAALHEPEEMPSPPAEGELPEDDPEASEPPAWPIFLDLESLQGDVSRGSATRPDLGFRLPRQQLGWTPPVTWLPLYVLFDPVLLFEFQGKLIEVGKRTAAREVERIATRFKDYPVPIVPITTDNLDLVTEGFQRVNSEGAKLSEYHMLAALTFGRDYDAGKGLRDVRKGLVALGWGSISETLLLNALKAALKIEVQKEHVVDLRNALRQEGNDRVFGELYKNAAAAVSFLRDRCGVVGPNLLPYDYQLVALIEAARVSSELSVGLMREGIAERLERWFWASTYTGYFTSMNSTQLGRAIEHVRQLAASRQQPADVLPTDMDRTIEPHTRFNFASARSTAFALLLARHKPLDASGEELDAQAFIAAAGVRALERILPQMSGTDPANRIIVRPGDARALRELFLDPSHPRYREICRSHLIGDEAAAALVAGRHEEFLDLRRKMLLDLEEKEVGRWGLMVK